MATTIKLKNGSGAPLAGDLVQGEPAFDLTNKRLYTENASGTVIEVGTNPTSLTTGTFTSTGIDYNATSTAITIDASQNVSLSGDLTVDTNTLYVDSTNNRVGIGTSSPSNTLTVNKDTGSTPTVYINNSGADATDGPALKVQASGRGAGIADVSVFSVHNISDEIFTVRNDGKVGIGTTSPANLLQVKGSSNGDGITIQRNSTTNGDYGQLSFVNSTTDSFTAPIWIRGYRGSAVNLDYMTFGSGGTERMRIDSSGNVGIGNTPVSKLDVEGEVRVNASADHLKLVNSATTARFDIAFEGSSGADALTFTRAGVGERMRIDSSGNVGIGVLSPTEKLHISGNALVGGEVESVASGTTTGFKWGQDTSTHYWKWAEFNNQTASLQENSTASGSSRIAIAAGGNVGIGTASPTGLLTLGTGTFSAAAANTSALYTSTTAGLVAVADGLLLVDRAGADVFKVDSSGNLLVGTTSQINSTKTGISASSTTNCLGLQNANNNNYFITALNSSSTEVFRVAGDGDVVNTNNSYGALSDERLKSNIVDASSQIDDIMAVQVRSYTLNETGDRHIGVVAQELEASGMSGLVKTDDEGIKSVKYSVLYMKAIKALQEAVTRIETLEAEVAALKGA